MFRYDPAAGGPGHFDRFELKTDDESLTTILDVLIRLQKTQDSSLAFRYACRVNMCGSCGMVINGREGLACKTNVWPISPRARKSRSVPSTISRSSRILSWTWNPSSGNMKRR